MGMLGNSSKGLLPLQKHLLYCSCVVPIATYGFRLWFFARAPTKVQVLLLAAMQHKAAFWILSTFHTSPTGGIEALVGLIPIYLHLKKLVKRSCLRAATLPFQHVLMSLLSAKHSKGAPPHPQSLALLNDIQCAHLKGPLLDTEAFLLNLTECFDPLHAARQLPWSHLLPPLQLLKPQGLQNSSTVSWPTLSWGFFLPYYSCGCHW